MCSSSDLQTKLVLLDKAKRPEEIDHWLKNGHKLNAMLMVTDEFGTTWMRWWLHLQPEWQGSGLNLSRDIPADGTWTELQKGGPNGFFLLILSYCWWVSMHSITKTSKSTPIGSRLMMILNGFCREWLVVLPLLNVVEMKRTRPIPLPTSNLFLNSGCFLAISVNILLHKL
jgi:hypothetical protein